MLCEYYPVFFLFVFYLLFLSCDLFVLLLGYFFLFYVMDYVYGVTIFLGYVEYVFPFMLFVFSVMSNVIILFV